MSKASAVNSSLSPTDSVQLESGLSLLPRFKFLLTIHRFDNSVKPLDEWLLKRSLIDFCKSSFSVTLPEDDLHIQRFKDLKKRKRDDPVARGALFIRDLDFLSNSKLHGDEIQKAYSDWRKNAVEKMDGIELSILGAKFKLTVGVPSSDDFDGMKKEWEELSAFGSRGFPRGGMRQPDTIVLRGVPSRWFAEPRVSSKPSMLVTHTIFSALGKIRNLDVAEDINKLEEDDENIVRGLQCKIVVRFEEYHEFCNALKVLSGRSLAKQGSQLRADYEVTWDKDGFSRNARSLGDKTGRWTAAERYKSDTPRGQSYSSRFGTENGRPKRFKE